MPEERQLDPDLIYPATIALALTSTKHLEVRENEEIKAGAHAPLKIFEQGVL